MLSITTNKEEVAAIAAGEVTKRALPLSDFWEKRIINLLGFADSDKKEIIHNLREGRPGTTQAEREVCFTAGGAARVRVMVTVKIGRVNELASETFVLSIVDVLEVEGVEKQPAQIQKIEGEIISAGIVAAEIVEEEAEQEQGEGMPNAPAIRKVSQHTGFCKYCNQSRIVTAPDGLSGADYNEIATEDCDCDDAIREREKRAKMEAAGMWAQNIFSKSDGALQLVLCAIRATFDGNVDYATIKIGKHTHKIDRDSDGMIRIKTVYRDSGIETF